MYNLSFSPRVVVPQLHFFAPRLSRVAAYSAATLTVATAASTLSLYTGYGGELNGAVLKVAAATFNVVQNQYEVHFDYARLNFSQGLFEAKNLRAVRRNSSKSNFDIAAGAISLQYGEPVLDLLRADVSEYWKSKDTFFKYLKIKDCKAKLEMTKEKLRAKTPEKQAAKHAAQSRKKDIVVGDLVMSNVKLDIVDRRKSLWAPEARGVMRSVVRKVEGDIVLPSILITHAVGEAIRARHAVFDLYNAMEIRGTIGEGGTFALGSGMTSDGDKCLERRFTAQNIPLNAALNGYLAYPLNSIQQANIDISIVSKPIAKNAILQSYDYLHETSVSFKDIQTAPLTETSIIRDATTLMVKSLLERSAEKNKSIDLSFDMVINESQFNRESFSRAAAEALTAKALQGGLQFIESFAKSLTKPKGDQPAK